MENHTDIAIIGAGPVGLFAIFEAGMLKMKCHVIDALDEIGGQCTAMYPEKPIYDIPAFPEIEAAQLIERLEQQAKPFSPTYHLGQRVEKLEEITQQDNGGKLWKLTTSKGNEITAKAVIIAAGCGAFGPNRPPLDNIEKYEGKSVFYMVKRKSDFKDKTIVIAGGGDSAVDWALSLCDIAKKIYVVHRRAKFRAAPDSVEKMHKIAAENPDKMEIVTPYQLDSIVEDPNNEGHMEAITLATMDGEKRTLQADCLLAFFGLAMDLGPIASWGLNLHMKHIEVEPTTCATNKEGIFAIGDVAHYKNKLKLILCGFSEAALAVHAARNIVFPDTALHFEYSTTKGVSV